MTPDLATDVPAVVSALLVAHEIAWNDAKRLAPLYADTAVALDETENEWIQGRALVAEHLAKRFARPYRILPLAWRGDGNSGHLAALYSRGEGAERRNVGSVAMPGASPCCIPSSQVQRSSSRSMPNG